MELDWGTLRFFVALVAIFFFFSLLAFYRYLGQGRGLLSIATGDFLVGFVFLGAFADTFASSCTLLHMKTVLFCSGWFLLTLGILRCGDYYFGKRRYFFYGGLFFLLLVTPISFGEELYSVSLFAVLYLLLLSGYLVKIFLQKGSAELPFLYRGMVAVFLTVALFYLLFFCWRIGDLSLQSLFSGQLFMALFFFITLFFLLTINVGAVFLEMVQVQKSLVELAHVDRLTSVLNRRGLEKGLSQLLPKLERDAETFAVIMADLDHFKTINDIHGHGAGDLVLSKFASLIYELLSPRDVLARYGGEEFIIVTPYRGSRVLLAQAELMRKEVAAYPFMVDGVLMRLTASFGCSVKIANMSWAACVSQADQALYRAKSKGRNCVESTLLRMVG